MNEFENGLRVLARAVGLMIGCGSLFLLIVLGHDYFFRWSRPDWDELDCAAVMAMACLAVGGFLAWRML